MRMKLTQYWVLFGSFFAATSISAAPPVRSNIDLNDVQSRSAQNIRRFDGVIRHEPQPTSRNTIRREKPGEYPGEENGTISGKFDDISLLLDQRIFRHVAAMRDYSEAAQLLLRKMVERNETFGADVLSEGLASTMETDNDYERIKNSLHDGDFNPLELIRQSFNTDTHKRSKGNWTDGIKGSLFLGFHKKSVSSNIPWDNVLYEPEEDFANNDLEEMFAKWEFGYSVAKFLWSEKLRRREESIMSTAVNELTERLAVICSNEDSRNSTAEALKNIDYIQNNKTLFSDITNLEFSDELATAIVSIMQVMSVIGNSGETINPYTKGSDIYSGFEHILAFEMKKENLTDNLDFFIRKYQKFIAFSSAESKTKTVSYFRKGTAFLKNYFTDCKSINRLELMEIVGYGMERLANYTSIKKYLTDGSKTTSIESRYEWFDL